MKKHFKEKWDELSKVHPTETEEQRTELSYHINLMYLDELLKDQYLFVVINDDDEYTQEVIDKTTYKALVSPEHTLCHSRIRDGIGGYKPLPYTILNGYRFNGYVFLLTHKIIMKMSEKMYSNFVTDWYNHYRQVINNLK